MPDFQRMLADAGVTSGLANLAEPDNMTKVMASLESFVEAYHASIEGDRQGEYGGKTR